MYRRIKTIPIFVVADASNLSNLITDNGSRITFDISPPIKTKGATIRLTQSNYWFVTPNIGPSFSNNVIYYKYNNVSLSYTFPQGIYSLADIQNEFSQHLQNTGVSPNAVILSGNEATNKVDCQINTLLMEILLTGSDNMFAKILGFPNTGSLLPDVAGETFEASNAATLNSLSSIFVHCDCVSNAYSNQQGGTDVLDIIPILSTTSTGSLQVFESRWPLAQDITKDFLSSLTIYLTDQDNKPIITLPEPWTLKLEITLYEE